MVAEKQYLTGVGNANDFATAIHAVAKSANLADYNALAKGNQVEYDPNAYFTASIHGTSKSIVYNAANFWQRSYSDMLGTLLHELIHLSNLTNYGLGDVAMQGALGLTPDKTDSTNISKTLGDDCFPGAKDPA